MKMFYTNENHFIVNNIKNLVEAQDVNIFIKNEFSQGAVGEISAFDSWPELWVYDDSDFDRVVVIVKSLHSNNETIDWVCKGCSETNDASFEICWNCQHENA